MYSKFGTLSQLVIGTGVDLVVVDDVISHSTFDGKSQDCINSLKYNPSGQLNKYGTFSMHSKYIVHETSLETNP